ncbi:type II toxin-antitoxin system HicA family toxin [uncultured Selenomonas sp.]|uniref:type II toxin-antitoxin system HicA family toxin n=1 Tax=uncultured Selenomonas sp. TaxID=159275 RepID=UPI0025F490E0|nr:type II toxin-antitoxin system HicA family toxin [uncultured Selenomonas sp.]
MTTAELIRLLKANGCFLYEHGSRHDRWKSPKTGKKFSVGRHAKEEVAKGTLKRILNDAGIELA